MNHKRKTKAPMRKLRQRAECILLTLCLTITPVLAATDVPNRNEYSQQYLNQLDAWPSFEDEGYTLQALGLLQGTDLGLELDRAPKRIEALVTVIRLIGQEDAAKTQNLPTSFQDVPDWATAYAGFGEANGLVQGLGNGLLGANDLITAQQYATMMLRVLEYDDQIGDFRYDNALTFASDLGILDAQALKHFQASEEMLRNDVVFFMWQTLLSEKNGADEPLLLNLCREETISSSLVYGTMLSRNEPAAEIARALKNGYSEAWYQRLCKTIDENKQILSEFNPVFKNCMYEFLKEPAGPGALSQLDYTLSRLQTTTRNATQDNIFKDSPNTLAYFSYPNTIVVRHDLNTGMLQSALTHELRHSITRIIENVTVEEGFTELWNQEVHGGVEGYAYYYVNIAKLFTFLIGAEGMNQVDLSGGLEDLLFRLESVTGVHLEKNAFPYALYLLSESTSTEAELDEVRATFLSLLTGYYDTNFTKIATDSRGYMFYVDTLIALEQLLYYPSTMIQNMDKNDISTLPSAYYTKEYTDFVDQQLQHYAQQSNVALTTLKDYYETQKNQRLCMKFFGSEAGQMLQMGGTAYMVTYQYEKQFYSENFGTLAAAEAFAAQVKNAEITTKPGAAFVPKVYN